MHGAAQWATFIMMANGARIVFLDDVTHMDPVDVLRTIEREQAGFITVVGDAVVRPLLEEIRTGRYDLSSLAVVGNGSVALTKEVKEALLDALPHILINDSVGSSETGAQGMHLSSKDNVATGVFDAGPGAVVVNEDMTALLKPGHEGVGWLGQTGWVPLGYLNDAEKTARTYPVIDGVRYSVPGDRVRLLADGSIELIGRESQTINTGGEKVFVEEVERAIVSHPAVRDVVVTGRPHDRWGNEVVAVVQLEEGATATEDELELHASERVARYKVPKGWVFVEHIQRSPSGKTDYRWAKSVARGEA